MGCILALLALISPRLALFVVWLFTDRFDIAFDTNIVPFVGFFILPWTTLTYTFAYAPIRGVSGLGWIVVVMGFILDVASWGGGEGARRQRAGAPAAA